MRRRIFAGLAALCSMGAAWLGGAWAWENTGANVSASREQQVEVGELQRRLPTAGHTESAEPVSPAVGDVYGVLTIPRIKLTAPIVEGTSDAQLAHGVGHYRQTPQPGGGGNVGLAGHRTTHGRPFWALDELRPGDRIVLRTRAGRFDYAVVAKKVVDPSDVAVLDSHHGRRELTMTTCNPRFFDTTRLVVIAVSVGDQS